METQILTVSSKGQISIPIEFRRRLALKTGDKLVAYTDGEAIMLKMIKLPTADEFKASLDEAQKWAASVGYRSEEIDEIIKDVRRRKDK